MINEIKQKVEDIKNKEKQLDIALQTVSIMKPLFYEVSASLQDKMQSQSLTLIQETEV